MKSISHVIQGVNIHFNYDQPLHQFMSNLFRFFYKGEIRPEIKPVIFDLSIVKEPPPLPENAVQAIKGPCVTCYSNGKEKYFTTKDGSIIRLDQVNRKAKGFLRMKVLDDLIVIFSLITAPFSEILKDHTLYPLHSAALYSNGVGYLISGVSGCGKTTTSLSLVSEGFKYVSDDAVLLEERNGEIISHSLFSTFNIDRELAEHFPGVFEKEKIPVKKGAKVPVDISQVIPASFIPYLRPDVIIFPKIVSNGESKFLPLGQMGVFETLLKQTALAVDKEASRNQLHVIGKLVKQIRGFELLCGRDIFGNPKRLVSLIEGINNQNGNYKKNKV